MINDVTEVSSTIKNDPSKVVVSIDDITSNLEHNNIFFVASRVVDQIVLGYYSCKSSKPNLDILIEISIGIGSIKICVRSDQPLASRFTLQSVVELLEMI